METIAFNTNWNGKLNNEIFTTFRPASHKFVKGQTYKIHAKGIDFFAEIIDIKVITLNKVNDWIAGIDTGYIKDDFLKIVRKMYANADTMNFNYILLKRIK